MEHIVMGLSDSNLRVRLAAVRCLHSLSRSVHQLRTTFQDHAVWRPLMTLLHNSPDDMTVLASSTLCNLLLEFSPCKEVRRNVRQPTSVFFFSIFSLLFLLKIKGPQCICGLAIYLVG